MSLSPEIDKDYEVVWEPIPGTSQELAVDTRAHHTLYHGTRGPGKTITQLMRYRRRVGLGYGSYWRGIIFDREYKNFTDIIAQSKRFFNEFGDGAKFHESPSDLKWTWPTGEELLFRHVKKLSDYDNFHGHEYCLEENTLLPTRRGPVKIKDVEVGDEVFTPNGFKKITRKFDVGVKNCVKASVYSLDGSLRSSQVQSEDHQVLTTGLKFEKLQSGKSHSVYLFDETIPLQEDYRKSLNDTDQGNKPSCELSEDGEIVAKEFGSLLRTFLQDLFCSHLTLKPKVNLFQEPLLQKRGLSILRRTFLKSFLRSQVRKANRLVQSLDQKQLLKLHLQLAHYRRFLVNVHSANDLAELHRVLNLCGCYSDDFYQCDVFARKDKEIYLVFLQKLLDVLRPNLNDSLDVKEALVECSRPSQCVFQHPYADKLVKSDLELSKGSVHYSSCGQHPCFDIEVEDTNNYITFTGLVNKNCFIGWNELTKQPTSELYDKLMSTNRSSFDPVKDTPMARNENGRPVKKDGEVVYVTPDGKPLPEIPLEVFSTTNPSGPGHNWVKRRFINPAKNGEVIKKTTQVYSPRMQCEVDVVKTQVAIFGSYRENIYLSPQYIAELDELTSKNKNLREAWLHGNWDVTAGGAIDDLWTKEIHVKSRFVIPKGWYIDRSFDWGSTHPFSTGWWAMSNGEEAMLPDGTIFCPAKNSLIRLSEWYGTEEIGTNKGLKLPAGVIADKIKEHEIELLKYGWILSRPNPGPADNQISNVTQKDVETIEKKMDDRGIAWEKSDKSPGSRKNGLELFRNMLYAALVGSEEPGIYFMDNCQASIETLPSLPRNEDDLDDVDTNAEDHVYDEVRYRVLKGSNRAATSINMVHPT